MLRDLPAPTLHVYPAETVVAEKLETMIKLAGFNSRMKDYFDLWVLFTQGSLDRGLLPEAVHATMERRGTRMPDDEPVGLGAAFEHDRNVMWNAFLAHGGIAATPLSEVVELLRGECLPILQAIRQKTS